MKRQLFILYDSRKPILTKQYPPQFVSQVGVSGLVAPPFSLAVMSPLWVLERGQCSGAGHGEEGLPRFCFTGSHLAVGHASGNSNPLGTVCCILPPRGQGQAQGGALRLPCPEALIPKLQMGRASMWEP